MAMIILLPIIIDHVTFSLKKAKKMLYHGLSLFYYFRGQQDAA